MMNQKMCFLNQFRAITNPVCKMAAFLFAAAIIMLSMKAAAADNLAEMLSEGTLEGEMKIISFDRKHSGIGAPNPGVFTDAKGHGIDEQDRAIGGRLSYKTGKLHGISFGYTIGSSNDFLSDSDKIGYDNGLLQDHGENNHHDGFQRVMEYYVRGEWFKTQITYGAHRINTPMANDDGVRMLEKSYKGLSIINNTITNLELQAHYITEAVGWNASEFVPAVSATMPDVRGNGALFIGGIKYKLETPVGKFDMQAWDYNMEDVFNISRYTVEMLGNVGNIGYRIMPLYIKQESIGDKIAGDAPTHQVGIQTGIMTNGFDIGVHYAKMGDNQLYKTWAPASAVMQWYTVTARPEEEAIGVFTGYDLSKIGVKGLRIGASYARYDTPDSGSKATPDAKEFNIDFRYDLGAAFGDSMKGISLDGHIADVKFDDAGDFTIYCLRLRMPFTIFGKK